MTHDRQTKTQRALAKAANERKVFQAFVTALSWPLGSITSEQPPAPDILYKPFNGPTAAFELGELVDESFAQALNRITNTSPTERLPTPQQANAELLIYSDTHNPLQPLLFKKLSKHYQSPHPIYLLLYWAGRSSRTHADDLRWLNHICHHDRISKGPFDGIWYWGVQRQPLLVWQRPGMLAPRGPCMRQAPRQLQQQ